MLSPWFQQISHSSHNMCDLIHWKSTKFRCLRCMYTYSCCCCYVNSGALFEYRSDGIRQFKCEQVKPSIITVWPLINDFAGAPTEHDPNTEWLMILFPFANARNFFFFSQKLLIMIFEGHRQSVSNLFRFECNMLACLIIKICYQFLDAWLNNSWRILMYIKLNQIDCCCAYLLRVLIKRLANVFLTIKPPVKILQIQFSRNWPMYLRTGQKLVINSV